MPTIHEFVNNNREDFLELPVEELAGLVLKDLVERFNRTDKPNRGSYCVVFLKTFGEDVARAVAEAWAWLELHGCLALDPSYYGSDVSFVTRRGKQLADHLDDRPLITEELHLRELLHPKIIEKSWAAFIRQGEEDLVVLAALKAVEVAVREASEQSNDVVGNRLVSEAFKPKGGILVDEKETESEKQAVLCLFQGAIGYCRNPSGHRDIPYSKGEAAEILMFASYLLRIVDSRREMNVSSGNGGGLQ